MIRLSFCKVTLWNEDWIMRKERGEPKPEVRVAWVKGAEREVDAFQRYLEGRNNRTW